MRFPLQGAFRKFSITRLLTSTVLLALSVGLLGGSLTWAQQPAEEPSLFEQLQQLKEEGQIDEIPPSIRRQAQRASGVLVPEQARRARAAGEAGSRLGARLRKDNLSDAEIRRPQARFNAESWPRSDLNFFPNNRAQPAGDVNGDGINDWIYTAVNVADNRTGDPSARTDKTFLTFGGEDFSARYFDELFFADLEPVGTFIGDDDRADAVETTSSGELIVYRGTEVGYDDVGSIPAGLSNPQVLGPADLDGDGFDDVILMRQGVTRVVFGAPSVEGVETKGFEVPGLSFPGASRNDTRTADITEDESDELIGILQGGTGSDVVRGLVFAIDEDRTLSQQQRFQVLGPGGDPVETLGNSLDIQAIDINDSGTPELLVDQEASDPFGSALVYAADTSGSFEGATPFTYPISAGPVGDVNGDGRADFAFRDADGNPVIGFGPENLEDGLEADLPFAEDLGEDESVTFSTFQPFSGFAPFGDVTGDEQDDFIVRVSLTNQFGPRLVEVTDGASATAETDFLFDDNTFQQQEPDFRRAVNVGDWDGDGTDDVALLFLDPVADEQQRVELYFGDPLSTSPDLTFSRDDVFRLPAVASGDFTDNGETNLAVGWEGQGLVEVFEVGDGTTPVASFKASDLLESTDLPDIIPVNLKNVGDVNDNGSDDLAVSYVSNNVEETKVFVFHDPALDPSGAATIDYEGDVDGSGDPDVSTFVGAELQPLGDVNDDGIDDFAVGDGQRSTSQLGSGGIYVHFGEAVADPAFDSGGDNPANVVIEPEAEGEVPGVFFFPFGMAAEDVTGNGHPDLVAKPFLFQDFGTGEGLDALFVYEGGGGFDGTADISAPIPALLDESGTEGLEQATQSLGEVTSVPSAPGSDAPRLMVGSGFGGGNAVLFEAAGGELEPTTILRGPDQNAGLGSGTNLIARGSESSGVGDYTGDGEPTAFLPQRGSAGFRNVPGYRYGFGEPEEEEEEEPVASDTSSAAPGDTTNFENTGTSVALSDNSEGEGDITVNRFESEPDGTGSVDQKNVSEFRVEITASEDLTVGAGTEIRFSVDRLSGVSNPENVVILTREIPGVGTFTELETMVDENETPDDPSDDELFATVDGFSEFAFASNTEPLFSVPARVAAAASRTFGEASGPGDFRLVALPGQVDRALSETLEGEDGTDWQAFWDDGSDEDPFQRFDGSETFDFQPGRGFWVTSLQGWSVSDTLETVALTENQSVRVPLNGDSTWTIVSNPLSRDVDWRSVQGNSDLFVPLWRFDAEEGFVQADTMRSARTGEAYYVLNSAGVDSLEIPFPREGGNEGETRAAPAAGRLAASGGSGSALSLTAAPAEGDDPASTVRVGLGSEAQSIVAPPGQFEAVSLRIVDPEASSERAGLLMAVQRVVEGEGETVPLRLTSRTDGPVTLRAENLEAIEGRSVGIIEEASGERHDLRAEGTVTLDPETETTELRLAVGTEAFIDDQAEDLLPEKVTLTSYPNPVDRQGTIEFALPEAQEVSLKVYDMLGREVATLEQGRKQAGTHTVQLKTGELSSGMYFGRLEAGDRTVTQKITVVR